MSARTTRKTLSESRGAQETVSLASREGLLVDPEPSPASSAGSVASGGPRKTVSPLCAEYCSVDPLTLPPLHPGSARGRDSSGTLLYSSSQTPHGFNAITKRKGSKKSVFSFDEADVSPSPALALSLSPRDRDGLASSSEDSYAVPQHEQQQEKQEKQQGQRRIMRTRSRTRQAEQERERERDGQTPRGEEKEDKKQEQRQAAHDNNQQQQQQRESERESERDSGVDSEDEDEFRHQLSTEGFQLLSLDAQIDWNLFSEQSLSLSPTSHNPRKSKKHEERESGMEIVSADTERDRESTVYEREAHAQRDSAAALQALDIDFSLSRTESDCEHDEYSFDDASSMSVSIAASPQCLPMSVSSSLSVPPPIPVPMLLPSIAELDRRGSFAPLQFPLAHSYAHTQDVHSAPHSARSQDSYDASVEDMHTHARASLTLSNTAQPLATALTQELQKYNTHNTLAQNTLLHSRTMSANTATLTNSANAVPISTARRPVVKKEKAVKARTGSSNNTPREKEKESDDDFSHTCGGILSDGNNNKTATGANSRASKSLAEISRRFVTLYAQDNTMDYIAGLLNPDDFTEPMLALHRVDSAAESLSVHVRRIYELIKILEILSLVSFAGDKRGKFSWRGTKDFILKLGSIQNDGIANFPLLAARKGLIEAPPSSRRAPLLRTESVEIASELDDSLLLDFGDDLFDLGEDSPFKHVLKNTQFFDHSAPDPPPIMTTVPPAVPQKPLQEEHFMVEVICKRFLQLFLVGMNTLSMSSAIQKLIPVQPGQSLAEYNKFNATKIRRVYDVTNVLCSLNLIRKNTVSKDQAMRAEQENNVDGTMVSDYHDLTDDTESLSSGRKGGAGRGRASEKADVKVLEWISFSPLVIRQKYLERMATSAAKKAK